MVFVGWVKEQSDVPIKNSAYHFAIDALRKLSTYGHILNLV